MCLATVRKTFKGGGKTVKTGYKWMCPTDTKGWYGSPCMGRNCKLGKWNTATTVPITASCSTEYRAGFHIFLNETDARKHWLAEEEGCVLVRVEYKGVVAIGTELDSYDVEFPISVDVVVAKYMKPVRKVR